MEDKKKYHHWSYLIMGILLIIVGLYAAVSPVFNLFVIAIVFIASGFSMGIGAIIQYAQSKEDRSPWHLVIGILNIIFSIVLLSFMWITISLVPFIVAIYLLVFAISLIILAVRMKDTYKVWWLILIGGILSALLAIGMVYSEWLGVAVIAIFISIYFIASGVSAIISFFVNTKKDQGYFSDSNTDDLVE